MGLPFCVLTNSSSFIFLVGVYGGPTKGHTLETVKAACGDRRCTLRGQGTTARHKSRYVTITNVAGHFVSFLKGYDICP